MKDEKRNEIIEIFRKFSLQRAIRKKMLHDLIDEIDAYYTNDTEGNDNE